MRKCCPTCGRLLKEQEGFVYSRDGSLAIDRVNRIVTRNEKVAHLSPLECSLVLLLLEKLPGWAQRSVILAALWPPERESYSPNVVLSATASRVRIKLAPLGVSLLSQYGQGMRLVFSD